MHQGQLEGKRERLPVQRVVTIQREPVNAGLRAYYEKILKATSHSLFREGRLHVLYSNNPAFISYARTRENGKAIVIVNASSEPQKGAVTLAPGLRLKNGTLNRLRDLYYDMKSTDLKKRSTVKPSYRYSSAQMIMQGLYVELGPFDAHLFLVEPEPRFRMKERLAHALSMAHEGWPIPRAARRLIGPALMQPRSAEESPTRS